MLPPLPAMDLVKSRLERALALRDSVLQQVEDNDAKIKALENEEQLLELVASLLRRLIDGEVMSGVTTIEKLQTEGLQEIFHDQDLSVKAVVKEERGKVSVSLLTVEKRPDGAEIEGFSDDLFGGAVMTMEEIFMRISVIFRRGLRPLLLLDETLGAVADKYVDRASGFLSTLATRLKMDVLLVSHDDAVVGAASHAYHVSKTGTKAVFRKATGRN